MHGMGAITQKKGFGVFAMPFHYQVLHEFIQPFYLEEDYAVLSSAFLLYSGVGLLSEGIVRSSTDKERQSNKQLKAIHALNEMVILASFVTTVVAAFLAVEGKRLCTTAATIHALCYLQRFYYETAYIEQQPSSKDHVLGFLTDVTKDLKEGEVEYQGREKLFEKFMSVLRIDIQANNPCLIGDAGSGKTELVRHLARSILRGKLKDFEGWTVYSTNSKMLMENTMYVGQLQAKVNDLFRFLKGKKAIVFIDEIHQALSDGRSQNAPDSTLAEALLVHMTDPNIRIIAATTFDHYEKLYSNEPLRQRFQRVVMPRMTKELRGQILTKHLEKIAKKHPKLKLPQNFVECVFKANALMGEFGLRSDIARLYLTAQRMEQFNQSMEEVLEDEFQDYIDFKLQRLFEIPELIPDDLIEQIATIAKQKKLEFGGTVSVFNMILEKIRTEKMQTLDWESLLKSI